MVAGNQSFRHPLRLVKNVRRLGLGAPATPPQVDVVGRVFVFAAFPIPSRESSVYCLQMVSSRYGAPWALLRWFSIFAPYVMGWLGEDRFVPESIQSARIFFLIF